MENRSLPIGLLLLLTASVIACGDSKDPAAPGGAGKDALSGMWELVEVNGQKMPVVLAQHADSCREAAYGDGYSHGEQELELQRFWLTLDASGTYGHGVESRVRCVYVDSAFNTVPQAWGAAATFLDPNVGAYQRTGDNVGFDRGGSAPGALVLDGTLTGNRLVLFSDSYFYGLPPRKARLVFERR